MLETWFLLLEYRSTLLPKLSIGLKGQVLWLYSW
jgi:hypothetical protein